jgi:ATP-binding cassette, subfamily B, bacterial
MFKGFKKPEAPVRELHAKAALRIFWQAACKYPRDLRVSFLYPVGMILLGVGVPYFTGRILASLTGSAADANSPLLMLAIVSFAGILCYRFGFAALWRLQAKVMSDLLRRSLDVLLRRSVGFHNNNMSGKLVSDALDLQGGFANLMSGLVVGSIPFVLVILIGLTVVLVHSWVMGAGLAVIIAVIIAWALIESRRRAALRSRRLVATKAVTGHFSDTIINAQTVKAFAAEGKEATQHRQLNETLRNLRLSDWILANHSNSSRMATLLVFQVGFLALVIYLVRRDPGLLSVGIFAFTYTFMLIQRLFDINMLTRQIEEALLQASPMIGIYLQDVEIKDKPGAPDLRIKAGGIELRNVSFTYAGDGGAGEVFQNLSLTVRPGEKIGLAGPSGGGKSTFTRLLLRFEDINEGEVLIDGQNIAEVTQHSLRRHIAYVAQEPLLFHRSIRENIAYGEDDVSDERIIAAAQKAYAHEFIASLPHGYDTIVGERGVKLSGGQRQRIAIARAILKDAPILILDEATSALDSESESLVQDALWKLMEGRTAIVIAHRLSTIQKMDRIIVLKDGRIVEEGPHASLIKKGGTYATLWSHQSGGFVRDEDEEQDPED